MEPKDFTKQFMDLIKPGQYILDLGAGDGRFSRMFAKRGAKVTAVDPKIPFLNDPAINSQPVNVEEFINKDNTAQYDAIFIRNLIQFLDKKWVDGELLPWLTKHLRSDGIVAIETFYREPQPPFSVAIKSRYGLDELSANFDNWRQLYAGQYEDVGPDMNGQTRHFFTTDLIVQK